MSFDVNDIRAQLAFGGARPNLFQVQFNNPGNSAGDLKVPFMVQASEIPAASIGEVPVPYFGRIVNVAGNRTYAPWTVTVMNDEDFLVRNALEEWSNKINAFRRNVGGFGSASPSRYKAQARVTQFGKEGNALRTYLFDGIFPTDISGIGLNWADNNQIEQFQVTFVYDYWKIDDSITGNSGGE
jgi:hypothetical protein